MNTRRQQVPRYHIVARIKTEFVYVCLFLCSLSTGSFEGICTKFGMWHPCTLRMVTWVEERRSIPQALALRAVYTPLQRSGELDREIWNWLAERRRRDRARIERRRGQ